MVQIKLIMPFPPVRDVLIFISHMVQIKQLRSHDKFRVSDAFISHMVQIKHGAEAKKELKRLVLGQIIVVELTFISHMVQIKHFALMTNLECQTPLYPTWFR